MSRKKKGYILSTTMLLYIIAGIGYWLALYRFDIVHKSVIYALSLFGGATISTLVVVIIVIILEAEEGKEIHNNDCI